MLLPDLLELDPRPRRSDLELLAEPEAEADALELLEVIVGFSVGE